MRVLVCGGRDFGYMPRWATRMTPEWYRLAAKMEAERKLLDDTLNGLTISVLIHGDARGADERASLWAKARTITQEPYPANWFPRGRKGGLDKSAGPARNQRMLDEGKPDLVVAFPGGRGTADMVRRARAAGVEVVEVPPLPPASGRL